MTFDEVIYGLSGNDSREKMTVAEVIHLIEILNKEYAPTVEMTSYQKENLLMMKNNKFSLIAIVAEFDDGNLINDFDGYWNPLTESQLVQAWLHPETIKVVDD